MRLKSESKKRMTAMTLYQDKQQMETWTDLDDQPLPINKLVTPFLSEEIQEKYPYPWKNGEPVLYLGEVVGMKGHGIFVGNDGLVRFGYHLDSFKIIPEEEL